LFRIKKFRQSTAAQASSGAACLFCLLDVAGHVPLLSGEIYFGSSSELSELSRHFGVFLVDRLLTWLGNCILAASGGNKLHSHVTNTLVFRLKEQVRLTGNWCPRLKLYMMSWCWIDVNEVVSITWTMWISACTMGISACTAIDWSSISQKLRA